MYGIKQNNLTLGEIKELLTICVIKIWETKCIDDLYSNIAFSFIKSTYSRTLYYLKHTFCKHCLKHIVKMLT